jgi:hypothetical protein
MTPEQQNALESVAGRALTPDDIAAIDPLLPNRNDVQIAAVLSASQRDVRRSIRVEELFQTLYEIGDYATIKSAEIAGNPLAVFVFAVLKDAKTLGPGLVNLDDPKTISLCDQLQEANLLSQDGRDALESLSIVRPQPIHYNKVSDALNVAEGRLTLGD